jgi:hypothetical protein
MGPRKNRKMFACVGETYSFNKSLRASANACNSPNQPTELGPNLLCILAIVFLSAMVIKATVNKTGTVTANTSRTDIMVGKYNIILLKKLTIKLHILLIYS